jgi:tripartite-type tricarboxylate transporter receptor subunit TctC
VTVSGPDPVIAIIELGGGYSPSDVANKFAEQGLPSMSVMSWLAVLAPLGTPAPIIARLNQAVRQVVDSQGFRDYALTQVQFAESSTPEGLADYMAKDVEAWRRVIEPLDLKVD